MQSNNWQCFISELAPKLTLNLQHILLCLLLNSFPLWSQGAQAFKWMLYWHWQQYYVSGWQSFTKWHFCISHLCDLSPLTHAPTHLSSIRIMQEQLCAGCKQTHVKNLLMWFWNLLESMCEKGFKNIGTNTCFILTSPVGFGFCGV